MKSISEEHARILRDLLAHARCNRGQASLRFDPDIEEGTTAIVEFVSPDTVSIVRALPCGLKGEVVADPNVLFWQKNGHWYPIQAAFRPGGEGEHVFCKAVEFENGEPVRWQTQIQRQLVELAENTLDQFRVGLGLALCPPVSPLN